MRIALLAMICAALPGLAAAQEFFTLKGHGGPIMGIASSADGRIATASFDNAVGLWSDGQPTWFDGHEAAVITVLFDGDRLLSAGDDYTIRRWPDGQIIGRHGRKVAELAARPGLLASASWDGTIGLWPQNGAARFLRGHQQGVNTVAFAPDGQLYSGSTDGTLRVWDVDTGADRVILNNGFGINKLVIGQDGTWLAYGTVDGVTRVIDTDTGKRLYDFTLDRRPVLALALNPDGTMLAVGDGDGFIMVVDTIDWRIVRDYRATLRGPVWALAFSPDGQNIYAGGIDDAVYSWPLADLDAYEQMATAERTFLKDPALMENGERQFARKCSICHTLTPGSARRAGPTLHGLFGRRAGTVSDYFYSEILTGSDIIWNETSVDALFDEGPDHYIPGSKMPMQRITDPQDRADLIAYLRRATGKEE